MTPRATAALLLAMAGTPAATYAAQSPPPQARMSAAECEVWARELQALVVVRLWDLP